jgi:Tol biopolymer transport system component
MRIPALTMVIAALTLATLADRASSETLAGGAGRDVLTGGTGASILTGRGGADVLYGDPVARPGAPRAMHRISVNKAGLESEASSQMHSFTADGTTMVFLSASAVYQPDGTANGKVQLFSRDMTTGAIRLLSTGVNGEPLNEDVTSASISPDGRHVAFSTSATNTQLYTPAPIKTQQLILKNLQDNTSALVTKGLSDNAPGNGPSGDPVFSPNGLLLAFTSRASNLDPYATNDQYNVFVVELETLDRIYRASITATGEMALDGGSRDPVFSPDSRTLGYTSKATTLLGPGKVDLNGEGRDIFLKSLEHFADGKVFGAVRLAATDIGGNQMANGESDHLAFSPNGREIAFISSANGLVPGDDTVGGDDVYVKRLSAGGIVNLSPLRIVSRNGSGAQMIGQYLGAPAFSPDGTQLAFAHRAPGMDTLYQVVVKQLAQANGVSPLTLISRNSAGEPGKGDSLRPRFIGHGGALAFMSTAENLVADDGNAEFDIFAATLRAAKGGADTISGGNGKDVIVGGPGPDVLRGGKGADTFVYLSLADSRPGKNDAILDFNATQGDIIDLSAIDANAMKNGNQAFTFIGSKPFDGFPGRLRFSGGFLSADVHGDRIADFAIRVNVTGGNLTEKSIRK